MSRKDYELIARVFAARSNMEGKQRTAFNALATDMAGALAVDNKLFDKHKFLIACGVFG